MDHVSYYIKEVFSSIIILILSFGISLLLQEVLGTQALIPSVFALAVFLISVFTEGYIYGVLSSLLSVLAVNYAFTFPYFKFNFTIPENLISALIMLAVTIITSALTTKIKQQKKERAETEKEKMRANLLRAISHDLRTPLTTIYGSCSAITDNYDSFTKEQKLKLLKGIQEDSRWLIRMVENLLSVTRIGGGKVNLIKTPTVLEELIDAVLVEFRKRYPAQKVEVEIPEEFISIPMDAMLIQQVLINFLENAVQHAHGMTELELNVYQCTDKVWFEVRDDGCGIKPEILPGIFTGYLESKESDMPVDKQKRNMGIGLSTCAAIIKAHGGEIDAKNQKHKGAIFRFSLGMEKEKNMEIEHG